MSLLKFVYRLRRIDDLIKRENTGASDEFAKKVGISRSMLMENLREMRELGAKIEYCQRKNSYRYVSDFELIIGHSDKEMLRGGKNIFWVDTNFQPIAIGLIDSAFDINSYQIGLIRKSKNTSTYR